MIEQNSIRDEQPVGLVVVYGLPVRRNFAGGVGAARMKCGRLLLRRLRRAKHLRRACLVEANRTSAVRILPHRFEQPQRSSRYDIRGVFGLIETNPHMRLRGQIVDFVRLGLLQDVAQAGSIGQVP